LGFLDTNVLIHAFATDNEGADCRAFLAQVQAGERSILLTAVVVHEFTCAVGRYRKQLNRQDIAEYLISLIALPTVHLEDEAVFEAVRMWAATPKLGFVDAYLAVRAHREGLPVFTKNVKHFDGLDVDVPVPLADWGIPVGDPVRDY
jgi:predicted nucleic acid-binding protein